MDFICDDCPRQCGATRGEKGSGFCRMGANPVLARAALHFDEEPVISGVRGAGAVFFSGCALRCRFCQNFEISHHNFGKEITPRRLRDIYFELIGQGAQNINLVNPTHFVRPILESLEGGLPVPVVWNSGGYERVETIQRLEGKVQVWLPDLKYIHSETARRYSGASDYFTHASVSLKEMLRQAGPVVLDDDGAIQSGVIVRHLILPGCAEESMEILDWIAENLPGAWVSLMAQYLPFGQVEGIDQLDRRASHGVDRIKRLGNGIGDVRDVLKDLIDAHHLEVHRVNRKRHALHQRVHLADGGLDLVGDLAHVGHDGLELGGDALDVGKRGLHLLLDGVDGPARLAQRHDHFDQHPHKRNADHHVHDGQYHVDDLGKFHIGPPVVRSPNYTT